MLDRTFDPLHAVRLRDRRDCERQTPGLFLRPRQTLEAALTLPERLGWSISRNNKLLLSDWQAAQS